MTALAGRPVDAEIRVGRIQARHVTAGVVARARYTNHGPGQPRSLTYAQQRARGTRPSLWPVFRAPAYMDPPPPAFVDIDSSEADRMLDDLRAALQTGPVYS